MAGDAPHRNHRPRPADPTPVLRSPQMRALVKQMEDQADMVIFDSPPLLVVIDPMLFASLVDGVLLSGDSSRTNKVRRERRSENAASGTAQDRRRRV